MPANSWKLAPGLNNVGSYQVSGTPFASGSCLAPISGSTSLVVRFPAVTKWVQIVPNQAMLNRNLRVAFSQNGLYGKGGAAGVVGGGYNFRIHMSSSLCEKLDLRVSELWFMSEDNATFTFDVVAGLTGIQRGSLYTSDRSVDGTVEAAGPNWSGSVGVG
tara:strand:- start:82 stop:561 length:480 start_codon:yes stop_codon:yes gene_type:complete